MQKGDVLTRVLGFLAERFPERGGKLMGDTRLGDTAMLDSLATLELVMFLEQEFGLTLDRADLDALATPDGIANLILRKQTNG